jgi:hypothetical protein
MHDTDAEPDRKSRRLLRQIEDLKALEARLHRTTRGSPEFHALEDAIDSAVRSVFDGDAAPSTGSRRPPT